MSEAVKALQAEKLDQVFDVLLVVVKTRKAEILSVCVI